VENNMHRAVVFKLAGQNISSLGVNRLDSDGYAKVLNKLLRLRHSGRKSTLVARVSGSPGPMSPGDSITSVLLHGGVITATLDTASGRAVRVSEDWQDGINKPIAASHGQFLLTAV
jgi:hypothetical protein